MFKPGDKIDNYEIIESIGEGGMGQVYLAKDLTLQRLIAIKTFDYQKGGDKLRKRFENEARVLAAINHPNIVSVYNFGSQGHLAYMVIEYIEGQNMAEIIKSRGFGVGEALNVFEQLLNGLQEAHQRGVIHRDIKPSNIIVNADGQVKLVDFGISKDFNAEDSNLTEDNRVIGTFTYMAPEVMVGERESAASDIFCLGIVFFEMLEGRHPFGAKSRFVTMENIQKKDATLSDEVKGLLPLPIMELLNKMLRKDPKDRYQSVKEVYTDFKKIELGDLPKALIAASRPEASIMNESDIRMKLLSKGYKTREIGIILSLAARLQEETMDQVDKTAAIDLGEKLVLTNDILSRAIKEYHEAKKQVATGTSNAFPHLLTHLRLINLKKLFYGFAGFSVILVLYFLSSKFLNTEYEQILKLKKPAPMYRTEVGNKHRVRTILIAESEGREVLQDTIRQIEILEHREDLVYSVVTDEKNGNKGHNLMRVNPFVPGKEMLDTMGNKHEIFIMGNTDALFPLSRGKKIEFEVRGLQKNGKPYKSLRVCEVTGTETVVVRFGQYPTWIVDCYDPRDKDPFGRKYYSPKYGTYLKSERTWNDNGVQYSRYREVVEVINWKLPKY